jgi:hypothetical protein
MASSSPNLWVQETRISIRDNGDRVGLGESEVYEAFTSDRGDLYRALVKSEGRCTGKIYIDSTDGGAAAIGWVFVARRTFEDYPSESSLIETWVTVHTGPPTVTIEYAYAPSEGI